MRSALPLSCALLLAAASPFALSQQAVSIDDAGPLPGDGAIALAGGVQQFPAIAAGDGVHLAVWEDHRATFSGLLTKESVSDLFGRRVAADGTPLDTLPFRITDAPGRKQEVQLALRDGVWLVAWQQEVPTQFYQSVQLAAVRIAQDGTILDPTPIAVRTYSSSSSLEFAIAADAAGWALVVQASHSSEALVEGYRVAPNGTVSAGATVPLLPSASLWTFLDLESNGSGLLLAGSSGGVLRAQRLSASLAPQGPLLLVAGGGSERPKIDSDGNGYLVAWENQDSNTVQARSVSAAGALGSVTTLNQLPDFGFDPSVAWTGTDYAVAYSAYTFAVPTGTSFDVRVARLAANGAPLDVPGAALGQGVEPRDPDITALADGALQLVWRDAITTPPHTGDVRTARLAGQAFGPAEELGTSATRQGFPDVVAGGPGFAAVFISEIGSAIAVKLQRLDGVGRPLDAEPIEVASGERFARPQVAWNGSSFLVAWQETGDNPQLDRTLARRVGPDGALLDPAPFEVLIGGIPDVAAVGDVFLVIARRAVTSQIWRYFGARIDGQGKPVGTELQLTGSFTRNGVVAGLADRWVIAWQRHPTHDNPNGSIFSRIVFPDGSATGEQFLDGGFEPAIAASHDRALVTWETSTSLQHVEGRIVDAGGVPVTATLVVGNGTGTETRPTVAWDGGAFAVAWEDSRGAVSFVDERRDVFGGRVTAGGTLLDGSAGVPLLADAEDEQQPALAGRAGSPWLLAASRFHPAPPHTTVRVVTATASSWSPTGPVGATLLAGGGTLGDAGTLGLALSGAEPHAPGLFVLGVSAWNLPLFGATLVPAPDVLLPFVADATGAATFAFPVGALPSGLTLWAQGWTLAAGAPEGVVASGALVQGAP